MVAVLMALFASSASASQTRLYTGVSFGPDGVAGSEVFQNIQSIAVDQAGNVFVYDGGAGTISKFDSTGQPAAFSALGTNVIEGVGTLPAGITGESQIAVAPVGAPGGTAGDIYVAIAPGPVKAYSPDGSLLNGFAAPGAGEETCGVAVSPSGNVFVGLYPRTIREYLPSANPPIEADLGPIAGTAPFNLCNVAADGDGNIYAAAFETNQIAILEGIGDTSPTLISPGAKTIGAASVGGTFYANRGDVVAEYGPSGSLLGVFGEGLLGRSAGVAVNASAKEAYVGDNEAGKVRVFGEAGPQLRAKTESPTGITTSAATLQGSIDPEGAPLEQCAFQWGAASDVGFGHEAGCSPSAAEIPPGSSETSVAVSLEHLQPNTTYRFRLTGVNAVGRVSGQTLTFTTSGAPEITEIRALNADHTSVSIEARINPRRFPTHYYIEWGPTEAYGQRVPVGSFEPFLGSGETPVLVTAELSGLSPATAYHYRLIASSGEGRVTVSPDQELETLNSCGLAGGRCLEMVSPPGLRLAALPQKQAAALELSSQAAEVPGRMAFETEFGFPGTAVGGESLYLSNRGPGGWQSYQYTPPMTGSVSGGNLRSRVMGLSMNLDCGVIASSLPLTAGAAGLAVEREGGGNLYRRDSAGGYTLITELPPTDGAGNGPPYEYELAGMSSDCRRVIFSTSHRYPGIPGEGSTRLYEWNEGVLRNIGCVPSDHPETPEQSHCVAAGEAVTAVILGNSEAGFEGNQFNAVSTNGDRVFFTATSQAGNDEGDSAVFARLDGSETLDVSRSPLTPDIEAEFQGATPDGSRVYFTANAGLTANSSPSGRDLYECHIVVSAGSGKHECTLTDLSVGTTGEPAEAGAKVESQKLGALVGVSDNGSRVYFIAGGQLVPGEGASGAQNRADGTLSLYLYEAATASISYVGAIGDDNKHEAVTYLTTGSTRHYTSRTSPNGRYLLFESTADATGYKSGHAPMVYLFDAEAANKEEALTCVSCRQDGKPGVGAGDLAYQSALQVPGTQYPTYLAHSLVVRNGQPVAFFRSRDPLAPGATDGEWNLYEWAHHQVFQVAPDLPRGGSAADPGEPQTLEFIGASSEGVDLYFVGATALNWEDPDARRAVWDARVGGGFAQPPQAAACNPGSEGSCQGAAPPASGSAAPGTTATSEGNLQSKPEPKKKHHKKKHHKKKHHKKKHHKKKGGKGSESEGRHSNTNGRAGK
jgi:hypothetical protein